MPLLGSAWGIKLQWDRRAREIKYTGQKKMFFLIRMAFWLSVVLALLPTFAGTDSASKATQSSVDAGDAVSAASATVSDLSGFCDRQPEACNVGAQAAVAFGHQAQAGARILYEYLNDRVTPKTTGSITAGNNAARVQKVSLDKGTRGTSSRGTLTDDDLAPAWRGPAPRKQPVTRHAS
jgi:hypothetical protein